jgi:hypothetical protein
VRSDDHAHVESAKGVAIPLMPPDKAPFSRLNANGQDAVDGGVMISAKITSAEFAVTCKLEPNDAVRAYVEAGIAPATRRA